MIRTFLILSLLSLGGLVVADDRPVAIEESKMPSLKGDKSSSDDSDDPLKKYPEFAKLVKGAKVYEGLFTLHQKEDHVYMEIRPDQWEKPYLMPIAIAKGGGLGGSTLNFGDQWVVLLKRVGEKVFLVRRNVRVTAKSGSTAAHAVETTYADSVLMAVPIKTLNPQKGTVVIDLNQIFFTDIAGLQLQPDQNRTTWHKIKTFKKNVELQVAATLQGEWIGRNLERSGRVVDARGVTLTLHYGLAEMPESGYQPRLADNRVGHFLTAIKDFSKEDRETNFVRMVNRWRLERADGSTWKEGAKLVPPKKKIVFWIENSVPEEYRTAVREGILEWNKAFEKIGFRDAIEVRQQENEEFDPEDMSYSTFRWINSDIPYAIGPSRANPLTGEILDADILFDGSFVKYYKQEFRIYRDEKGRPRDPASLLQALHHGWDIPEETPLFPKSPQSWNDRAEVPEQVRRHLERRENALLGGYCACAAHKRQELATWGLSLAAATGKIDDKAVEELLQQAVKEVAMHEVGHTLGLRHNFRASALHPNDKLHDTAITRKSGLTASVMDYCPVNLAPKGIKQGDYFTTTLGAYDYWAIEYAYKPLSGGTEGEVDDLKKIAARSSEPQLAYGTDEDLWGSPDPQTNLFDLGADPLRFGIDRCKLAKETIATMTDKVVDKGESWSRLRMAFSVMLNQYGNATYLATRHVGGISVSRDFKGDGRDPLTPVSAEKQREALKFLQESILTDKMFSDIPPDLLRKLAVERWYHWGMGWSAFRNAEYPFYERVLAIQEIALEELLSPETLNRVQNNAASSKDEKPVTLAEIFRSLADPILADLRTVDGKAPAVKSSIMTRNLQRAFVSRLVEMMVGKKDDSGWAMFFPTSSAPTDAKNLARFHLKELVKRIDATMKEESDDVVKAHLDEMKERITKALNASVSVVEP